MSKSSRLLMLFPITVLSLALLNGCGGGTTPPPDVEPVLTINVFDKTTGSSLPGVSLSILETGEQTTLTGHQYQATLDEGTYTVYMSKDGYITRGFVFALRSNLTFNTFLSPEDRDTGKESVTGEVSGSDVEYCNIYAGNQFDLDYCEVISNSFEMNAVPGVILVSAYTTKVDGSIDKIAYLPPGPGRTELELNFAAEMKTYSGNKDPGSLIVKQGDGYHLARQEQDLDSYSFGVAPIQGDSILLELHTKGTGGNYLTRVNAGANGGAHDLRHQATVPAFEVAEAGDCYVISFDQIAFADYYEVYALHFNASSSEGEVAFWTAVLSGTSAKVPKNLFSQEYETTLVYVRAVRLPDFILSSFINESRTGIYKNCWYTESAKQLGSTGFSSVSPYRTGNTAATLAKIRAKFGLNGLCSE